MNTQYQVSISFDVFIDLDDMDITEQDILNAFGAEYRELSDAEVQTYIKEHLAAEDIYEYGNIQNSRVGSVTYSGKRKR